MQAVLDAALGTTENSGSDLVSQIRAADTYLGNLQDSGEGGGPGSGDEGDDAGGPGGGTPPDGGEAPSGDTDSTAATDDSTDGGAPDGGGAGGSDGAYDEGNYLLAFLGEPSEDGTWQLHLGGHHLAVNITYADGEVSGASPFFVGVEPTSWEDDDGTTYVPLDTMKDGMEAMITSLSDDELAEAKLDESFTDVLMGTGEDGNFPEAKAGIKVSDLSEDLRALVLEAMKPWVSIVDDASAEDLLAVYEDELADTYVSYSGGTDFTERGDYVRIDGQSVWIEFVCQDGVVITDQIHYHTIYRDHERDYGGELPQEVN